MKSAFYTVDSIDKSTDKRLQGPERDYDGCFLTTFHANIANAVVMRALPTKLENSIGRPPSKTSAMATETRVQSDPTEAITGPAILLKENKKRGGASAFVCSGESSSWEKKVAPST